MRVFQFITATMLAGFLLVNANAQVLKTVSDAGNTINAANNTVAVTSGAITNAKNTIKGLLGNGNSKEANIIAIAGIEYGNEELDVLKKAIKSIKGVKDVVTSFKDGTVTITIKSKDNATELWDKIPATDKLSFKPIQADEKSILLEYKTSKTDQSKITRQDETPGIISVADNHGSLSSLADINPSRPESKIAGTNASNHKASYFVQYDFQDKQVNVESETLDKATCSATVGGVGRVLTVSFFNKETQTGINFELGDFEKIKATKYEFDSEKTNKEKSTWQNATEQRQLHVKFAPGDGKLYTIQCALDPDFHYQGSGYLSIIKINPVKGGIVEGEFQFSFPVYKIKNGPAEIQQVNSGKFRVAIQ